MENNKVDIRIQFKDYRHCIFGKCPRNELVIRLQPSEAMYFKFVSKKPGLKMKGTDSDMDLTYKDRFPDRRIPQAYETLILDVLNNNQSNFVRSDELEVAWKIFTPILHQIDKKEILCEKYPYGSRGPESLKKFMEDFGYKRDEGYKWQSAPESKT